jgi:hypothetical protein
LESRQKLTHALSKAIRAATKRICFRLILPLVVFDATHYLAADPSHAFSQRISAPGRSITAACRAAPTTEKMAAEIYLLTSGRYQIEVMANLRDAPNLHVQGLGGTAKSSCARHFRVGRLA